MGILNVTPDSFSDGGLYYDSRKAVKRGLEIASQGAGIIDIGAESTRPGSAPVAAAEQIRRIIPVIKGLAKEINIPLSVDTSDSEVAEAALANGAAIINDITGLRRDKDLAAIIAKYKAACVIMHIKGVPQTMQSSPRYNNLMQEICRWLKEGISIAKKAGISEDKIVVDPGIGFGKTVRHNLEIIRNLSCLADLGRPVLVGPSRKSFIGKILGVPVHQRLMGTSAAVCLAVACGADIVRVHDIKEMAQVTKIADLILR